MIHLPICTTAPLQTQLFRMRYDNQDMAKDVDEYTVLFSQFEFMGKEALIPETHKAAVCLASIEPACALKTFAAAFRTKDAAEPTWKYVSTTLIDEYNARSFSESKPHRNRGRKKKRGYTSNPRKVDDSSSTEDSVDVDAVTGALAAAFQSGRLGISSGRQFSKCEFCGRKRHTEANLLHAPGQP